ncbi:immunoglobulin superfamily member 6-like [Archocentrus centrarchus]|uniref:immunoglobulin superfamily member 6-like n=1 Tax=Archocentrus centrarchus TaxID=63155 RepID=UPI0011EA530D|nr:immunoglobulin superfamily member 6-like [Archocentrus centrarchus]
MRNFDWLTVFFLCSLSWISVSVSDSQTLEVHSGEEVTLLCSNFSSSPTQIIWFRVTKGSRVHCITSLFKPHEPASFCTGFENGNFEMSTNISTVFLKIKQVDLLDSGLYFCGWKFSNNPVIVDATYLVVQDMFERFTSVVSVILAVLTVLLIAVTVCLAVKIKKLHKAHAEEQNPQQEERQSSEHLDYAAVTFHPKRVTHHRPASDREVDPNVIYSSTR